MSSVELDNLVKIGKLKREPASPRELHGLRESALARLEDAGRSDLRFDPTSPTTPRTLWRFTRCAVWATAPTTVIWCSRRYRTPPACRPRLGECWPRRTNAATSLSTRAIWSATNSCSPN